MRCRVDATDLDLQILAARQRDHVFAAALVEARARVDSVVHGELRRANEHDIGEVRARCSVDHAQRRGSRQTCPDLEFVADGQVRAAQGRLERWLQLATSDLAHLYRIDVVRVLEVRLPRAGAHFDVEPLIASAAQDSQFEPTVDRRKFDAVGIEHDQAPAQLEHRRGRLDMTVRRRDRKQQDSGDDRVDAATRLLLLFSVAAPYGHQRQRAASSGLPQAS